MRMKALRTFKVGDTGLVVNPHDEFESKNGLHYERLGLATQVHGIPKVAEDFRAFQAAPGERPTITEPRARPTSPTGGETGAAPLLSSSLQAPAPAKRRYTKRKGAPES